jgi:hypothetical protein
MYVQGFRDQVYDMPSNALPPQHLLTVLSQIEADNVRTSY